MKLQIYVVVVKENAKLLMVINGNMPMGYNMKNDIIHKIVEDYFKKNNEK